MIITPQPPARLVLSFPFDKDTNALVSRALGAKYTGKLKKWWCHDTVLNRDTLFKLFPDLEGIEQKVTYPHVFDMPGYLMDHQKWAVEIAKDFPRWGYFYDTGTGKTLCGIEIYRMLRIKTLVLCPLEIIKEAWIDDIAQFAPGIKAASLHGIKPARLPQIVKDNDIVLLNFESFKKYRPLLEKTNISMLMIDESSKLKNNKAMVTKEVSKYAENMTHTYLFSGTPAPNSDEEYFSQIACLDPSLFGKSFYRFREIFFYPSGYGGFKWKMRPDMRQEFLDKLASISSVVNKHDVLDLPERTYNKIAVSLSPDEKKAYEQMRKDLIAEIDEEEIEANNAAVKAMKLRQVTAGFLIDENKQPHYIGKSKLTALCNLLEEIGDHQVLIWTQFIYEAEQIMKALGNKAGLINGSVPHGPRRTEALTNFKTDITPYLVAHPKTIQHGITLVNCTYAIYYSLNNSHEQHKQTKDRIYRKGQHNACTYYYLVVPGSVDEDIYQDLQRKKKNADDTTNFIKMHKRETNPRIIEKFMLSQERKKDEGKKTFIDFLRTKRI